MSNFHCVTVSLAYPTEGADCTTRIDQIKQAVKMLNDYCSHTERFKAKLIDVDKTRFTLYVISKEDVQEIRGQDIKLLSRRLADKFLWKEMSTQPNKLLSVSSTKIKSNEFNLVPEFDEKPETIELTPEIRQHLWRTVYDIPDRPGRTEKVEAQHEIDRILSRFL